MFWECSPLPNLATLAIGAWIPIIAAYGYIYDILALFQYVLWRYTFKQFNIVDTKDLIFIYLSKSKYSHLELGYVDFGPYFVNMIK